MSNLTTLIIVVSLVWHFPNLSISDKERLLEYFLDGLPSDDGAFGFLKPLLWAAAGDISLNVRFLLNWLLRKQIVWSCQELNFLSLFKRLRHQAAMITNFR